MKVHEAVVDARENETGITIHWVNEHYDEGAIIFQAKCEVLATDTAQDVAEKIHQLEGENFPRIVEEVLKDIEQKS
jgi:phosphoribosylglycinamide formyltransferase-1